MELTIIGTANPCPQPNRTGNSFTLTVGGETLLIDCGPNATYGLIEQDIDISAITKYFFTHHHMDHNVDFFHLSLVSWYLGREELVVFGPTGTEELIQGFNHAYNRHIEDVSKWREINRAGVSDIEVIPVDSGFDYANDEWRVSAMPVSHAYDMDTYAYRFVDRETGRTVVFSGDTKPLQSMVEFAKDADVLVHDCNLMGDDETLLSKSETHPRYFDQPYQRYFDWLREDNTKTELKNQLHTNAEEAGKIAERARVDTLVLTHFNPLRNLDDVYDDATALFSGSTIVGQDGLTIPI